MKLTSQMPSSTCLMPSFWPAFSRESARERLRHCQAPFPLLGHTTCPLAGTAFRDADKGCRRRCICPASQFRSFDQQDRAIHLADVASKRGGGWPLGSHLLTPSVRSHRSTASPP